MNYKNRSSSYQKVSSRAGELDQQVSNHCPIAVKGQRGQGSSYSIEESIELGACLQFQRTDHYHHSREHSGRQEGRTLEQ